MYIDNRTIIICYNVVLNKLYKQQEKSDTELLKADLHGTTLSHARDKLTTSLQHESFRVNQTYNLLTIVAYDTKNVVGF